MGFYGSFYGGGAPAVEEPVEPPVPLPVPVVYGDPTYVDHVEDAIDRLCEQFKSKATV